MYRGNLSGLPSWACSFETKTFFAILSGAILVPSAGVRRIIPVQKQIIDITHSHFLSFGLNSARRFLFARKFCIVGRNMILLFWLTVSTHVAWLQHCCQWDNSHSGSVWCLALPGGGHPPRHCLVWGALKDKIDGDVKDVVQRLHFRNDVFDEIHNWLLLYYCINLY